MTELSLHILDVAENSITAGAKLIRIAILASLPMDKLTIEIDDDGKGMSKDMLKTVTDPFTTTRKTRKVGLGLPLFKMAAETAGGSFWIDSELGKGTKIRACFQISHIDRQPLGDIPLTLMTLINSAGEADILFTASLGNNSYALDTRTVKEMLEVTRLDEAEILAYLKSMIKENLDLIFGGTSI